MRTWPIWPRTSRRWTCVTVRSPARSRIGRRRVIGGVVAAVAFLAAAGRCGRRGRARPGRRADPAAGRQHAVAGRPEPSDRTAPGPTARADPTAVESTASDPDPTDLYRHRDGLLRPDARSSGDTARLYTWAGNGRSRGAARRSRRVAAVANADRRRQTASGGLGRRRRGASTWPTSTAAASASCSTPVDGQCWGPVWAGDSAVSSAWPSSTRTDGGLQDTKGVYDFGQDRF